MDKKLMDYINKTSIENLIKENTCKKLKAMYFELTKKDTFSRTTDKNRIVGALKNYVRILKRADAFKI